MPNFKAPMELKRKICFAIPLIPPPRTWHILFKASCSIRLFTALGTPSDGVISPTIAIEYNTELRLQYIINYKYFEKNYLINKALAKFLLSLL